jgi:hypothetical protein
MSQPVQQVARQHQAAQVATATAVGGAVATAWGTMDPAALMASWRSGVGARILALVFGGQLAAAGRADPYVAQALAAQSTAARTDYHVVPRSLAGIASDGRPLDSLLVQPVITVLTQLDQGVPQDAAMQAGAVQMDMIVRTAVADAGRVADSVATTSRPQVTGYVRMLVPPSCSRCVVLAGRWYRWDAGFNRHPRCDCVSIPADEDATGDLTTNPAAYFDSLSEADQNRAFTRAGAQAIRDGADLGQVVNARRGMDTAGESRTTVNAQGVVVNERHRTQVTRRVNGRDVFVTTEGTTRRGRRQGVRLMPESIYAQANGDRDAAIRLLRLHGYIR